VSAAGCLLMGLPAGTGAPGEYDAHVHLYTKNLPMVAGRRYTPDDEATLADLAGLLRANGLAGALVVQPSFLGTDNSHLVTCLADAAREHPDLTFRGVAVLDPATPAEAMAQLAEAGITGIRFNLDGTALPDLAAPAWRRHLAAANDFGWHVELHIGSPRLPEILPALLDSCDQLVIDHFGRPDPVAGLACPGMQALLAAPRDRITIKLSAPYRIFPTLTSDEAASYCVPFARAFADRFGPDRLVWASDWPWTRFSGCHSYTQACAWRALWHD
jgi:predicted TIM-barrel fold metal-dependent hydrolase